MNACRAGGLAALAGVATFVVVVVALHLVQPGYDPAQQLMSELALGPHGSAMILAFTGVGVALLGVQLAVGTRDVPLSRIGRTRGHARAACLLLVDGGGRGGERRARPLRATDGHRPAPRGGVPSVVAGRVGVEARPGPVTGTPGWYDVPRWTRCAAPVPLSRLGQQIAEAAAALRGLDARFALIGGLALASHRVARATQDVDLLVEAERGDDIHAELLRLGYRCLHRSEDAANYLRGTERLDLLYATRPIARRLLASASETRSTLGELRVVSAEGLIGFKLQALANDASRTQDFEDIRALLRANRTTIDLGEVREYFRLFEREALLDDILRQIG